MVKGAQLVAPQKPWTFGIHHIIAVLLDLTLELREEIFWLSSSGRKYYFVGRTTIFLVELKIQRNHFRSEISDSEILMSRDVP